MKNRIKDQVELPVKTKPVFEPRREAELEFALEQQNLQPVLVGTRDHRGTRRTEGLAIDRQRNAYHGFYGAQPRPISPKEAVKLYERIIRKSDAWHGIEASQRWFASIAALLSNNDSERSAVA